MSKITTFVDHIGRTIIGEIVSDAKETLTVKNPAIIHVQPTQTGQLNVQTIPLYFKEFISDKNKSEGTTWQFNKHNIVLGVNIDNDSRLLEQYQRLFTNTPAPAANPEVVKLFDE
ncbi:MAG: hypothetical protein EBU90_18255 [Proteobacteria bacterium]|nr:hypothetical protein [Pseudomonadota bacterium]NBP15657.1 hypothetical protein [bacterium]